ncbi:mechanosensitive ion channel family protein, partial [Actinomyces slackii]
DEPTSEPEGTPTQLPTLDVNQTVEAVQETGVSLLDIAWRAGLGAAVGLAVVFVVLLVLRMLGSRRQLYSELARFGSSPGYLGGALTGAYMGAQLAVVGQSNSATRLITLHALLIGVILAATWLLAGTTRAVEATVVANVRAAGNHGRTSRVTTQAQILRRVAEVIVIVCGLVGAVMTFPSARVAMGSLLASAGLVSVIAGLAARSTLGNIFAGVQLATTDAIRVGDLVVVDTEQGTIEEITLTYVVMRTWDDRRLVLPSTHFTENPFANWSRGGTQGIGGITMELDWRAPVAALRVELARIVAASSAWDGREASLEVADAVGGILTIKIAVSGKNSSDIGALKSHVREELVTWLQREAPYALPRTRVEVDQVEITQDPTPEHVARLAEELIARQKEEARREPESPSEEAEASPPAEAQPKRRSWLSRPRLGRGHR